MLDFINKIYFVPLRLYFKIQTTMQLPVYHATVLHGVIGEAFKQSGHKYSDVFIRNRIPENVELSNSDQAPRAYIIIPPEYQKPLYLPEDEYYFDMIFIGDSVKMLDYSVFEQINRLTIYYSKAKIQLQYIVNLYSSIKISHTQALHQTKQYYVSDLLQIPEKENITIKTQTPIYIKHLQSLGNLSFTQFYRLAYQRLLALSKLYCDYISGLSYKQEIEQLNELCIGTEKIETGKYDYIKQKIDRFKVFSGIIEYIGCTENYFAVIDACSHLNIGSAITYGFGKYKIE